MIEIYFKSVKDDNFQKIEDFRVGSWVHIDEANLEDLNKICEITGLELSDLSDSLDRFEIPRVENIKDSVIVFARHPADMEEGLHTSTLAIVLSKNYIITISPPKSSLIDTVINSKLKLATTQKSKLFLSILLKITQDFTSKIKLIRNTVIDQENKIKSVTNETIVTLTKNEEILNQYLSSLIPLRNLLEAITTGRYVSLYEKDHDLLQDLMIAIKQSEDICAVSIKSIRSLRDSYQILFTNDVNKTIKLLTAITIIFTIPTIIASFYGMNISLPLEKSPYAFMVIMNFTLIICLVSVYIFMKKKWL